MLRRGEGTAGVVGLGGTERWSRGVAGTALVLLGFESFMEVEDDGELVEVDKAQESALGGSRGGVEGRDSPVP